MELGSSGDFERLLIMHDFPHIEVAGENAFIIYCGKAMGEGVLGRVRRIDQTVRSELGALVIDTIPSYASLLVIYRSDQVNGSDMKSRLKACLTELGDSQRILDAGRIVTLPVWYSFESGADLKALAELKGLRSEEVITLHQEKEYQVYAIGFAPGFAYLGEVDERIAVPRLSTPRKRVPCGAVGIAGRQTAVYPSESPGGWNLIGRCPVRMFDLQASEPMPVRVGDCVRFEAIGRDQYMDLGGQL